MNQWLDQLALPVVIVDGRRVSTWRLMAGLGLLAGLVTLVLGAARLGISPIPALSLVPCLLGIDLGYAWLRRRRTGGETWVLYEHLALALVVLVGLAGAFGLAPLSALDLFWPPFAVLFAFGRVGCLAVGCCHGVACSVGVRHEGVRRAPVQLVESLAWFTLAAGGWASLGAPAGLVVGSGLCGYALVRWTLEGWRGDPRPAWRGLSAGRWGSLVAGALGIVLVWAGSGPPPVAALLGVGVAVAMVATRHRWLDVEPTEGDPVLALASRLREERPATPAVAHLGAVTLAGSWVAARAGWALSTTDTAEEDARERLTTLATALGAAPGPVQRTEGGLWFMLVAGSAADGRAYFGSLA